MARNVAVAIGVGKATGFTELPGAIKGAKDFIGWAERQTAEQYECRLFTDAGDATVDAPSIRAYLKTLTDGTVSKLLLYFAGHGLSGGANEDYWVLSNARSDATELVAVRPSLDNARAFSRVPHIVAFADACRSPVGDMVQYTTSASPLFLPSTTAAASDQTKVDAFFATQSWKVAREANEANSDAELVGAMIGANGYFTHLLLEALYGRVPDALSLSSGGSVVVAPRKLEFVLKRDLPLLTGEHVLVSQVPDAQVTSSDGQYVAHLRVAKTAKLTFEAHLPDGALASAARVMLLQVNDQFNMPIVARSDNGVVSAEVAEGKAYGAEAVLDGYVQMPDKPEPLAWSKPNATPLVVPLFARPGAGTGGQPPGREQPPPRGQLGEGASLTESFAIDGTGAAHTLAPRSGVYTVVTEDVLSGRVASEVRLLAAGAEPAPTRPLEADPKVEDRLAREVGTVLESRNVRKSFETHMGLCVTGATVLAVHASPAEADVEPPTLSGGQLFYSVRGNAPGTAVIELDGERYAGLAILPEFLGVVDVGPNGVRGLSYSPTSNSAFYAGEENPDLVRTRKLAEAAVRTGRLDLMRDEARPFARSVRTFKHVDPVLGVLAAYAYYQAGNGPAIESMISAFRDANQLVPFDLLLLAGKDPLQELMFAPEFPMLAQGWGLLGSRGSIPTVLDTARANLAPALWTTVLGSAGRELAEAVVVPGGIWQPQVA